MQNQVVKLEDTGQREETGRKGIEEGYVPSRYSKAFNQYARSELQSVTPILKAIARTCTMGFKYPVFKVLKAVAKIFLLNQMETVFFTYMVRETKWDVRNRFILQNSEHVRDIVACANDHPQYKSLILYLMLVAYSVKHYLNEGTAELKEEASRICPNFAAIFQNWVKKHATLLQKISLKALNKVYVDLHFTLREQPPDHNLLVDSILQISPAYNPEKSQKDKRFERNHEKKETHSPLISAIALKMQPVVVVHASGRHQADLSIGMNVGGISSRMVEVTGSEVVIQNLESEIYARNLNSRFAGAFQRSGPGTSNVPISPMVEQDCEEINLGMFAGNSDQNIILPSEEHTPVKEILTFEGEQKLPLNIN